jgi:hypothetical protein
MGRAGICVIITVYELLRYDANSGTPHSAIFRDKSLKNLKSNPGVPHSTKKCITD